MFEAFCREKLAPLLLRLTIGMLGACWGYFKINHNFGFDWYDRFHPAAWQAVLGWTEFCTGIAILLGLYCRLATGAYLLVTTGFLIWHDKMLLLQIPPKELVLPVLLFLMTIVLVLQGAGPFSLDGRRRGRSNKKK